MTRHPHLLYENYLTFKVIKRGRINKICEHCKLQIEKGVEHKVHMFPEYETYATHLDCSLPFASSLG